MKSKKTSKAERTLLEEQQWTYKKIGERLKELQIERGYANNETFAYENDISRSQYSKYLQGADMRISSLVKILKSMDISIQEFFSKGFDN